MEADSRRVQPAAAMQGGPPKRPYNSPILRVYGCVRQFTLGSGGMRNDGMGVMTMSSDRACKTDVTRIGTHPLGIGLYLFDYKARFSELAGHGRQFGVMADEVEAVMPDAVAMHPDGFKRVNYAMLGIDLSRRCLL